MRYALVGFGRMGRAIDAAAQARGHRCSAVVDRRGGPGIARAIDAARWRGIEVAFEFTEPMSAKDNVIALLERGVGVVCGTTGWDAADPAVRKALARGGGGLIVAPNFSIGVAVFARLVSAAAGLCGTIGAYDPWIVERHHRGKRDAPSGTAKHLAHIVAEGTGAEVVVTEGMPDAALPPGAVHVVSVRAGQEPGRHTVGFDGPFDRIELTHAARGREGFAAGAVLAAEWLIGRRGRHDFGRVVNDLGRAPSRPVGRGGRR
jgi:4-hydroxy-tetrahydrodipicolinate reductase